MQLSARSLSVDQTAFRLSDMCGLLLGRHARRVPVKGIPVIDSGMTPVPTRALADLWHAIDRAVDGLERALEIESANHEFDPDCDCEHCADVRDIDRLAAKLVVDAALDFRQACEEVQPPIADVI